MPERKKPGRRKPADDDRPVAVGRSTDDEAESWEEALGGDKRDVAGADLSAPDVPGGGDATPEVARETADPRAHPGLDPGTAPVRPRASALPDEVERPLHEAGVGVLAAALAVLVFLPWYSRAAFDASGWSSGTWGPVVLGLAVAAVAIVVLRRLGVAVQFPVHHALVLEGIGWAAVGALLIKRVWAPRIAGTEMGTTGWLIAALIVALGIALVAGSVSQGVVLVLRPGWFAATSGRLGAGVLALGIAAGGAFGVLNDVQTGLNVPPNQASQLEEGYPECAERLLPVPEGVEPDRGGPAQGNCLAVLRTELRQRRAYNRYINTFEAAGWTIVYDARQDDENPLLQMQARRGADCATVLVQAGQGMRQKNVTLIIGPPEITCNLEDKLEERRGN